MDEREQLENEVNEAEDTAACGGTSAPDEETPAVNPEDGESGAGGSAAGSEEAQADAEEAESGAESEETAADPDSETDEPDMSGDSGNTSGSRPKGIFGRREKKELAKKDAEIADIKDRYMRTLAEYENFRKRTEKEKADIYTYAVKDVMNRILPVLDNLERGVAAVPEESKDDPFAQGMDRILKQFEKALDDIGVKPIDAVGQPFDPNLHNAVIHVEDESLGSSVVAEDLQKGYTYKDSVVRHSMVKVAN